MEYAPVLRNLVMTATGAGQFTTGTGTVTLNGNTIAAWYLKLERIRIRLTRPSALRLLRRNGAQLLILNDTTVISSHAAMQKPT